MKLAIPMLGAAAVVVGAIYVLLQAVAEAIPS